MKKRLLGALMVIPAVSLAIIFAPSVVMLVLFFGIAILGILEFYRMLDKAGIPSFRYVGAVCGTMMMLATYLGFVLWGESVGGPARAGEWEGVILTCTVLVLMVRQFPQKHNKRPLATIACTLLGILYVPLLLGFFIKLSLHWEPIEWNRSMAGSTGCYLVFYLAVVMKMADTGALIVGKNFGRHKLFPRLSPAKTWEGFIGGTLTAIGVSCAFLVLFKWKLGVLDIGPVHGVILGVLIAISGLIGDLAESLLKRAASVKDSGGVVPGIGGVLDVFDSLMFSAPVLYLYLRLAVA